MKILIPALILSLTIFSSSCAHQPEVKQEAYATLKDHQTFEYEFPVVWKGIEKSLEKYKIVDRDPDEVSDLDMKKITKRSLETEWVYAQSRDKYVEYKVNDSPRKIFLQTRVKYFINAERRIGGTDVTVKTKEEIEKLNEDGTSAGYESVDNPDTSRPREILDKINLAILSAGPSNLPN